MNENAWDIGAQTTSVQNCQAVEKDALDSAHPDGVGPGYLTVLDQLSGPPDPAGDAGRVVPGAAGCDRPVRAAGDRYCPDYAWLSDPSWRSLY